jgi:hypothetical protein
MAQPNKCTSLYEIVYSAYNTLWYTYAHLLPSVSHVIAQCTVMDNLKNSGILLKFYWWTQILRGIREMTIYVTIAVISARVPHILKNVEDAELLCFSQCLHAIY